MIKRKISKILLISFIMLGIAVGNIGLISLKNNANAQFLNISPRQAKEKLQNEIEKLTTNQIKSQIESQLEGTGLSTSQLSNLGINPSDLTDFNKIKQFGLTNIQNSASSLNIPTDKIQDIIQIQNDIQNLNITDIQNKIKNLSVSDIEKNIKKLAITNAEEQILKTIDDVIQNKGLDALQGLSLDQLAKLDPAQLQQIGLDLTDLPVVEDIQSLVKDITNFDLIKNLSPLDIANFNLGQFANLDLLSTLNITNLQNLLPALGFDPTSILLANLGINPNLLLNLPLGTCIGNCNCKPCGSDIITVHQNIKDHVTQEFVDYRTWLVEIYFPDNIQKALALMAEQLTTIGMQQVAIIGGFFDAKHQLETQRLFQTLVAQAHKDYHPSEELCEIGTGVRSLATSERRATLAQVGIASRMMQRQLLSKDVLSGKGSVSDRESRMRQFRKLYCNPNDNSDGLHYLCSAGGPVEQRNRDVNFTNTIENELTLDIDFINTDGNPVSTDQINLFAISANLFGHQVLTSVTDRLLANENNQPKKLENFYLRQRAIAAKRSVAQNSFAAITGMRAQGNEENAPFLKAFIKELGVEEDKIDSYLGASPSYFAQMEILTKKMYQNPKFYADLYDKPVNIERKGAALQAIALMQDRDIYNSLIRSEAVLATLLETLIRDEHDRVTNGLKAIELQGERQQFSF